MWWDLLLAGVLVVGTQAFHPAPIRWGGRLDKRLVLASTDYLDRVAAPQQLTVKETSGRTLRNKIFDFSTNPDNTISCSENEMRWCLEANGTERGHVVLLNHCTGKSTQRWNWLRWGQIQLERTNQCIHVNENRGWKSVRVELRECANKASEIWTLEDTVPSPARSSLQHPASTIMNTVMAVIAAALSLGAWLWWWRKEARMVALNTGALLNMDWSGVCLVEPMGVRLGDMALAAGMTVSTRQIMASGKPRRFDCHKVVMKVSSERDSMSSPSSAAGELFIYNDRIGLVAFEFGEHCHSSRALVCIGGLTDGLLSLRYLPALAEVARNGGWRTIQPVLSSSYCGWGQSSLNTDVEDLDTLLRFLRENRGISEVVLLGSSTGCQDVVQYLRVGQQVAAVVAAILQAPVSDREAILATNSPDVLPELEEYRRMATAMIANGNGEDPMPRAASLIIGPPHVVTAYRFDSLTGKMTDDDMFSSDLTPVELSERLGHIVVPTLIAISSDDEYVPASVDSKALAERVAASMGAGAVPGYVQNFVLSKGGHGLHSPEAASEFSYAVSNFLNSFQKRPQLTWVLNLKNDIEAAAAKKGKQQPLMVALVGIPASGKTTLARVLRCVLGSSCLVISGDGFHLPLAELHKFPDSQAAIYRRGAPDTFDPVTLEHRLSEMCDESGPSKVLFPSFDHAVGDPVPDDVCFERDVHKVVIVEGLYLLHQQDGWQNIRKHFDLSVYVDADLEESVALIKQRNKVIPGYTEEEIEVRCDKVDRANAHIVQATACNADVKVSWDGGKGLKRATDDDEKATV